VSLAPGKGGLDPSVGVDLTYWVDDEGFSKKMVRGLVQPKPTPIWIDGLMILKDERGRERLVANYLVVDFGHGLVVWNEDKQEFGPLSTYPEDEPLHPRGQPIRVADRDGDWL
jgi:hypothetical protein